MSVIVLGDGGERAQFVEPRHDDVCVAYVRSKGRGLVGGMQ